VNRSVDYTGDLTNAPPASSSPLNDVERQESRMYFETDTTSETTATVDGIVALLVTAGLNDAQIRAVTGRDARFVRELVTRSADAPPPEGSVIDRARATLLARAEG
jgi:hypothetical protein